MGKKIIPSHDIKFMNSLSLELSHTQYFEKQMKEVLKRLVNKKKELQENNHNQKSVGIDLAYGVITNFLREQNIAGKILSINNNEIIIEEELENE